MQLHIFGQDPLESEQFILNLVDFQYVVFENAIYFIFVVLCVLCCYVISYNTLIYALCFIYCALCFMLLIGAMFYVSYLLCAMFYVLCFSICYMCFIVFYV